jgi:hypothetical protein
VRALTTTRNVLGRASSRSGTLPFVRSLVLAVVCASCHSLQSVPAGGECRVEGPLHLTPRKLTQVHRGLAKSSVDRIMGAPTQSPAPGQYYYFTGGQCPLGDPAQQLSAPCGLVADFQVHDGRSPSDGVEGGLLQSCWWGPIVLGFSRELGGDGAR